MTICRDIEQKLSQACMFGFFFGGFFLGGGGSLLCAERKKELSPKLHSLFPKLIEKLRERYFRLKHLLVLRIPNSMI